MMKPLAATLGVILLVFVQWTSPARSGIYGKRAGFIYLTRDTQADPHDDPRSSCNDDWLDPIPSLSAFNWYLMVEIDFADAGLGTENGDNGMQAWEASVRIPEEITVTSWSLHPARSVNVGIPPPDDTNDSNWIVGTGELVAALSTPFVLATYTGFLAADATNLLLTIGPANPSSFTEESTWPGVVPGWVEYRATGECDAECLRGFRVKTPCEMSLAINYTFSCETRCLDTWPTETTSWGAIKARF